MYTEETLMLKYIQESPAVSEEYLNSALDKDSLALIEKLANKQPVILTGCGTSYHLALLGERYFQSVARVDAWPIPSFDLAWYRAEQCEGKIVLAISQSGASKATRDAIAVAKQHNALTVSITAGPETPMAKESDLQLVLPGGKETALPKTRVYTTGAVQLLRLAYEARRLTDPDYASPFPAAHELREAMERVLEKNQKTIDIAAQTWNDYEMFTFCGAGAAWVAACEAALKMRENNYTFAEGYETEEFAHGRTCSFMSGRPLVAFALRGPSVHRTADIINNAKDLQVPTMVIVEEGVEGLPETEYKLWVPAMPSEFAAAIVAALTMQLFSHQFTLFRDVNPDTIRLDQPDYELSHNTWIFPPGTH